MKKLVITIIFLSVFATLIMIVGCVNDVPDDNTLLTNYYTVTFEAEDGGKIFGEQLQTVAYGEKATKVSAIADDGYVFVKWSDNSVDAERVVTVYSDMRISAIFEKKKFTVKYNFNGGYGYFKTSDGTIYNNEYIQVVEYNDNSDIVTAVAGKSGYTITDWSDGYTKTERQELNVTSDITVTANIGIKLSYSVADNVGGRLIGNCNQIIDVGEDAEQIIALPDDGYIFSGWSDLLLDAERQDKAVERSFSYFAYFEPVIKTFNYDYFFNLPYERSVSIDRFKISETRFIVPEVHEYEFCGWYADKNYSVKVIDETGLLMLGYYLFSLDTETLFAKWQRCDDEVITYKVLSVIVEEIDATLISKYDKNVEVNYKMSAIERKILSIIPNEVEKCLNEWFEGKVIFEFDTYFTLHPITTENFNSTNFYYKDYSILFANNIPEVDALLNKYHCVMTFIGMNDYGDLNFNNSSGVSTMKYGALRIESILSGQIINNINLQEYFDELLNGNEMHWKVLLTSYLHEFTHTIETKYTLIGIAEYHSVLVFYSEIKKSALEATKLYLFELADINGDKLVGIPTSYWQDQQYWSMDSWIRP